MMRLRLYTTLGCHLCERLEALLATLCRGDYRLEAIEISEDDALVERYGVRIPVLVDQAGDELDRGFEPARLAAWLEARGRLDAAAWERLQAGESPRAPAVRPASPGRGSGRRYLG